MYAIFLKEINTFFSSLIGYISVGVFLLIIGLFLWVFPDSNILDYGYATLEQLFGMAPNVFLLLIPAITMRSFAEENQNGTIELLATRPVSDLAIILGKYWACIVLLMMSLVPTLIYYVSIYQLGEPAGNIDTGAVIGSYIGLLLIGGAFTAIGLFASAMTNNQIVSFVFAIFLCFVMYLGFDNISAFSFSNDRLIQSFGMNDHYSSLSRGLIDLRDVLYFLSVIAIFLGLTKFQLERRTW
jgi:ABC-2 type transport system permease protein